MRYLDLAIKGSDVCMAPLFLIGAVLLSPLVLIGWIAEKLARADRQETGQ